MKFPIRPIHAVALVAFALGSCTQPVRLVAPEPEVPSPTTPQDAVKRFEWAVVNRNIEAMEDLFTADFVFISAGLDSAGNPTREAVAGRDAILARFRCMFADTATARIRLSFDGNFVPLPDPRPDHPDSLFKTIRTSLAFTVETGDGSMLEVTGYALFFLVRGDVAAIPTELQDRFQPDRRRWWIQRWEDQTTAPTGAPRHAAQPTKNITLWAVLRQFDCPP